MRVSELVFFLFSRLFFVKADQILRLILCSHLTLYPFDRVSVLPYCYSLSDNARSLSRLSIPCGTPRGKSMFGRQYRKKDG